MSQNLLGIATYPKTHAPEAGYLSPPPLSQNIHLGSFTSSSPLPPHSGDFFFSSQRSPAPRHHISLRFVAKRLFGFPKDSQAFETQKSGGAPFSLCSLLSHPFPEAMTAEQPRGLNGGGSQEKKGKQTRVENITSLIFQKSHPASQTRDKHESTCYFWSTSLKAATFKI